MMIRMSLVERLGWGTPSLSTSKGGKTVGSERWKIGTIFRAGRLHTFASSAFFKQGSNEFFVSHIWLSAELELFNLS